MNIEDFFLLDASARQSVIGGFFGKNGRAWKNFTEEKTDALEGVFSVAEKSGGGNAPELARGFLFCEGPGSILGIRIAAAAIRAWLALDAARGRAPRPVFAFQSLAVAAALLQRARPQEKTFSLVAESRMRRFNVFSVENGVPAKNFRETETRELAGNLFPKVFVFAGKTPPAQGLADAEPFNFGKLLAADPAVFVETPNLLRDCGNAPDAVNTSSADSYAHWTPTRHRGA